MASKKTKVVDGYTAIRAAQEAARHGKGDPLRKEESQHPKPERSADPKAGTRIGRSVLPTKREVICPACGEVTQVTGKIELWVCTKCRHRMKLQDVTLKPGDWLEDLEVGGNVTIPADTRLTGGSITANDILLLGEMRGCEVRACRKCTIGPGAKPDWVRLNTRDLEISHGVSLVPGKPVQGRHLHVRGSFSGTAVLDGKLAVYAGGDFSGKVKAAGLEIEEGGGLRASLDVDPAHAPPPVKRPARAGPGTPGKAKPPPGKGKTK